MRTKEDIMSEAAAAFGDQIEAKSIMLYLEIASDIKDLIGDIRDALVTGDKAEGKPQQMPQQQPQQDKSKKN